MKTLAIGIRKTAGNRPLKLTFVICALFVAAILTVFWSDAIANDHGNSSNTITIDGLATDEARRDCKELELSLDTFARRYGDDAMLRCAFERDEQRSEEAKAEYKKQIISFYIGLLSVILVFAAIAFFIIRIAQSRNSEATLASAIHESAKASGQAWGIAESVAISLRSSFLQGRAASRSKPEDRSTESS
jgi:hypothetical protein